MSEPMMSDDRIQMAGGPSDGKGRVVNEKSKHVSSVPAAPEEAPMTLAAVRQELKGAKGKRYWRSIDELAGTPEFEAAVEREFPAAAQEWVDPVSRRGFMKLMGASMALAGLAGCTKQPDEPIYPYVKAPEDLILGKPNYFASAPPFVTGAVPVLVKSDQFRPIKVDGNPEHPYNQGSSDVFTQGALLDLYDPDRSSMPPTWARRATGQNFAEALRRAAVDVEGRDGHLLPERDHHFAHAGAAVEGGAGGVSQGEAGAVRSGDCGDGAGQWYDGAV